MISPTDCVKAWLESTGEVLVPGTSRLDPAATWAAHQERMELCPIAHQYGAELRCLEHGDPDREGRALFPGDLPAPSRCSVCGARLDHRIPKGA